MSDPIKNGLKKAWLKSDLGDKEGEFIPLKFIGVQQLEANV